MSLPIDVSVTTDPFLGGLEASHVELKKQNDRVKRFANPDIQNHSYDPPLRQAVNILQPEQILRVLQSASDALSQATPGTQDEIRVAGPQLAPVPFDEARLTKKDHAGNDGEVLTGNALMFSLMSKIMKLTSDTSLQNLLGQLKVVNASFAGACEQFSDLANQLEKLAMQWAQDFDAQKVAQEHANALEQQSAMAESDLHDAQNNLNKLREQAAQQQKESGIVDPDLQQRIDHAERALVNAEHTAVSAKTAYERFLVDALGPAQQAEKNSKTALQQLTQQAQQILLQYSRPQQAAIESQRKDQDSNAKSLEYLMAVIAQLINQSASDDLAATAALRQKLAEATAKEAEKNAVEYQKQIDKAKRTQEAMGWLGKALGWLITGIGFIAAIFTGGASLVLAAIGLALTLGDEISQRTTGVSFMQEAMKPIMEKIVQPLMNLLGDIYSKIFQAFGVPKETAEMIGQVMGAIAAAVILIVGVSALTKGASKLIGMAVEKLGSSIALQGTREIMKKMIQKIMDSCVGQVIKFLRSGLGRRLGMSESTLTQINAWSRTAQKVIGLTNLSIQTGGNIAVADMWVEAEKAKAKMTRDMATQEILNTLMDHVVDKFAQQLATMKSIIENMAEAAENRFQAQKYVTRKIGSVAG